VPHNYDIRKIKQRLHSVPKN